MTKATRSTNRSFAVAIFFVVLAAVVIGAAFWVLNRVQAPATAAVLAAPGTPSRQPSLHVAAPLNDVGVLAKAPLDPDELKRRQQAWAQTMEALAAIRGGEDVPSFADDLASFNETCATIEQALAEDPTPQQKQALLEQLQQAFAALSEHDTRQASDGEERLAAIDRAFRRMQVLIDAGELQRLPAAPDERQVQPAKSLVRARAVPSK